MNSRISRAALLVASFGVLGLVTGVVAGQQDSPQQRGPGQRRVEGVYKDRLTPHWLPDNVRFWYRNDLKGGTREFILVNAQQGVKQKAFDHARLAAALSRATGTDCRADQLPFRQFNFVEDGKAIVFKAADKAWKCDLTSYEITPADASLAPKEESEGSRRPPGDQGPDEEQEQEREGRGPVKSPDARLTAYLKDGNVYVREGDAGQEIQLSTDGVEGNAYSRLEWSPDSSKVIAWRLEPGDRKEVYLVRSSPSGGGRAQLEKRPYALPGDKFNLFELNIFDLASRKQIRPVVDRFEHEWARSQIHWRRDGRRFSYEQVDRGHQRLRVIEVDSATGDVRNLVDERSQTFIWTAHTENLELQLVNWLKKTDDLIYVSEKDGWRHLYLVDPDGKMSQITKGQWVVRAIDLIDEDARQVWFRACGMYPDQDPYFVYYYRVNFDGTGFTTLTEGNGNHFVQGSPDAAYYIDTYSRVDMPPIHNLRRSSDGKLVCELEKADISELEATGWRPPEVFVAKGRDGKTDIWGIITRPRNLDPAKKYPVIESIYNGPQGAYVPKSFSGVNRASALNDLGFIVVQMDAMGTAFRSKAFHDVCWHNLKDAGLPDRILWHQAAAKRYPYYDITRVGIFGNSAGGQNAAGALLFYPDFYKVGVASCGCHDNRMDKASWNEQWMGYPVGPQYAECSNIENASRLRGKLMLEVGEMDTNVPPESTYRFVDALIRANKDFDFLLVPNANHGPGGSYGIRRMQDYFVRHLLGAEPPDRNAVEATAAKP